MNEVERINKKLGFGLMRLPMKDGEVDIEQTCLMVDEFIKAGFNYFDTAHGYLSGESEKAAKNLPHVALSAGKFYPDKQAYR